MTATRTPLVAQARIDTPLGPMLAAATATGLAGLWFDGQAHHPGPIDAPIDAEQRWIVAARHALATYFDGQAAAVELPPLDLHGTPFQQAVWRALRRLAAGQTAHYAQIAQQAGSPAAVRAAGAAIGRNPVWIVVPCHRVLGRDGGLTGYAGGLDRKRALLRLEGVAVA